MDNKLKIEKWVLILLMFLIAFVTLTFEDKGCCGRIDGSCTKCCTNYQMIDRTCQECPAGFWDNNCSRVCQYPYFGINCLQTCQCNKHLCGNVEGCPDKTTMNNPQYTTSTSVVNGQMTGKKKNGSNKSTVFLAITAVLALIVITIVSLENFIGRKQRTGGRYIVESHNL